MYNSDDPRSYEYKRVYNKTPINKKRLITFLLLEFIITVVSLLLFKKIYITLIINMLYFAICLKYILIFLVKIYQKLAPISIRSKCRFEPSCSNYMLESLEKYGLITGLKKGISRLKRCNISDGGYDYP